MRYESKFDSQTACNFLKVIVVPNIGRAISALLEGFKNYINEYEYICFVHDVQSFLCDEIEKNNTMSYETKQYKIIGEAAAYKCYENVLASKVFVENVITTFKENPNLGLLVPPSPYHNIFYNIVGNEWGSNYLNVKKLADKLGLQVDINQKKAPIAPFANCFWFRSKALKPLFNYDFIYEELHSEPKMQQDGTILNTVGIICPFVAQSEGYYSGWILSDIFANFEITNLYKQLRDCYQNLFKYFGIKQSRHALLYCVNTQSTEIKKIKERINELLSYEAHLESTLIKRDDRITALLDYVAHLENTISERDERINALLAYVDRLEQNKKK